MARTIPVYDLDHYRRTGPGPEGVFVATLAESIAQRYGRRHPHIHPFYQAFFVSGEGRFMHDFRDYALRGPTLVFASPGQIHAITLNPRLRGIFVSFTQDFFDHAAPPPSRLPDFPFFYSPGLPPLLPLKGGTAELFRPLFADMKDEFTAAQPGAADVIRAQLQVAFTRAARLYARAHRLGTGLAPADALPRPARLAREFRLAVEHRFRNLTTLPAYAALLQVTANHLNDTLRREARQSAGEVIRQRRLLEAKRLLLHSDLGVAEIGYHLGFDDPSYFGRFFLRGVGASPVAFRDRIREKYQRSPA